MGTAIQKENNITPETKPKYPSSDFEDLSLDVGYIRHMAELVRWRLINMPCCDDSERLEEAQGYTETLIALVKEVEGRADRKADDYLGRAYVEHRGFAKSLFQDECAGD